MLKIGLTGGIGSGKSYVCAVFEKLGVPVFYADDQAKLLMNENVDLRKELIKEFGEQTYSNQNLDREYLAKKIFSDESLLKKMNSIVHPYVRNSFNEWAQLRSQEKYVLEEAAILFESGAYNELDYSIVISAPEELKIQRVIQRNGVTRQDVLRRMSKQMSEEERISRADFVIYNDEKQMLLPQIVAVHEEICKKV